MCCVLNFSNISAVQRICPKGCKNLTTIFLLEKLSGKGIFSVFCNQHPITHISCLKHFIYIFKQEHLGALKVHFRKLLEIGEHGAF